MAKKQKNRLAANEIVKKKIPYERTFEEEGIIETRPHIYSKCYFVNDIRQANTKDYSQVAFNKKFKKLLDELPEDISFQFVIHNKLVDQEFFLKKTLKVPEQYAGYEKYVEAYNEVIAENSDVGHNNVKKDTYFVISMTDDLPEGAVKRFREIDDLIKSLFSDVYGIEVSGLALKTRLKVLHSMFNPGRDNFGSKTAISGSSEFNFKNMKKLKLTTKDVIAPVSIDSKESHKDYMVLNDEVYVRSFFINVTPAVISNSFVSDITSISSNMLLSIQYDHIPAQFGLEVFTDNVAGNMTRKIVNRRESLSDRKNKRTEEHTTMINYTEQDYFNNAAIEVFKEGIATGTHVFACSIVITLYADELDTLNRDTQLLYISTNKYAVQIKSLDLLQLEGFQSCLPLCNCRVDIKRIYNLDKLAMMHPLNIQEVLKQDGLFNGLNAINDNLVFFNRKNFSNSAGIIAGVDHCGKTFQCKREIFNAIISSKDRICIISTTDDYDEFVEELKGGKKEYPKTNVFECVKHYGLLESDIYSKSIMLEALFKAIYVERESEKIDFSKLEDEKDEDISEDVKRLINLSNRGEIDFSDGESVITYIEDNPGSFVFLNEIAEEIRRLIGNDNAIGKRVELYKVKGSADLISAMNFIWNRSLADKAKNISTWLFIDSVDKAMSSEQGLDYLMEYIDKCNKLETIVTMVIQSSVKLMSDNKTLIRLEELINGCTYYKLLNQGAIERKKYSELLNIPNSLINYITNVDYGKGLIITPSSNIAFDDNFVEEKTAFYELFKK